MMSTIVQPDNAADNSVYNSVNALLNTSDTNAQIDANPLFQNAEAYIVGRIPSARNRTYTGRTQVLLALGFIAASYMLRGSSPATVGSDTIRSETIGIVRREYATSKTTDTDSETRAEFLFEQGDGILDALLGTAPTGETDTGVSLTASRL